MRLVRCNPNRMVTRNRDDFENFFGSFFGNHWHTTAESGFHPRVEVTENDDHVNLKAELPGLEKDAIKVMVEKGVLTISGERKSEKKEDHKGYHWSEISHGSFSRSFTLPDNVEADKIEADYKNGILDIKLPKVEQAKPKEIEVKIN